MSLAIILKMNQIQSLGAESNVARWIIFMPEFKPVICAFVVILTVNMDLLQKTNATCSARTGLIFAAVVGETTFIIQ